MQIILVHRDPDQNQSVTLTYKHLMLGSLIFMAAVLLVAWLLYYLTFRATADFGLPLLQEIRASMAAEDALQKDRYVKRNLAAMAIKLGEMQAQLMRLDALGERVQGLAGIKPEEFNFKQLPGRGGPAPTGGKEVALNMSQFQALLEATAKEVEHRADYLNVVESTLMDFKIKAKLLPTTPPVDAAYSASGFGWRIDPFTGRSTFHKGIDFPSPVGTPIIAAAGGVVIAAEYHPDYGNMLELDHGNEIVTRYAHASRLLVKVGDIVRRGQHIADIGSTGRSTGPHLHFEVSVKGVVQDPQKFLAAGNDQAKMISLIPK
jgi:murein DD-endopeptidase MepM/ murein hydrolase activator NlpD